MGAVLLVNALAALLLTLISLGHVGHALTPHPIVVPDDHRSSTYTGEGSFKYNISIKLPDVISVSEYHVRIQPYYPVPGIALDPDKNMTFDGTVVMPIHIKNKTSEITLNAHNLNITSLELTDILLRPVAVSEIRMDNEIQQFSIVMTNPKPAGTVLILSVNYTGLINSYFDGGIYYTNYLTLDGKVNWMVSTQLGAFAARAAFPCMDEPAYKAIFHIELVYPSSHIALSNMMEGEPVDIGNGWSKVAFKPTPLMSTYLVAFTIGPYVSSSVRNKDGTLVRAWGWKGQEDFLSFTAKTAAECLYQMGLYTKIKFPLEKCDHLAQPQFPAGAMENYGLVLYKYQFVAYNSQTMTTIEKTEAARVICHEVSHQWVGNLVTCQYWDDLFLNEGLATYFMRILMASAFPDMASFVDAEIMRREREVAFKQDGSATTHPLITLDGPFFDSITYQKGGMLLRLMSDVMGVEPFRDGIQQYLSSHQYSTASHLDLFSHLDNAAKRAHVAGWCGTLNITHLMEPYFHQTSYPVIHVHGDKSGLDATQEPFNEVSTRKRAKWNYTWIIPLRIAQHNMESAEIKWLVPKLLENPSGCQLKSPKIRNVVSYASATYGRIFYDSETLNSLLKRMIDDDNVPVGVKISLIGDEVAFIARQKSLNQSFSYDRLLNILVSVFNSSSGDNPIYSLTDIALPQFEFFASLLRDSIDAPLIERLFEKIFHKIYKSDLWEESTSWDTNAFKYIFLPYAVRYNLGNASEKALKIFDKIVRNCQVVQSVNGSSWCNGVPNDVRRAVYCAAAKYDNDKKENFEKLKYLYSGEVRVNPYFYQEYRALLEGMTCAEGEDQLNEIIAYFVKSPLQPPMIFGWLQMNPRASDALYNFIKKNSDAVLNYKGLSSYLNAMIYNWKSEDRLQQFSHLQELLQPKMNDDHKTILKQQKENLKKNIKWAAKYSRLVTRWMYDNLVVIGKDRWNERLPGNITPERYDVHITPYIPGSGKYEFYKNFTFDGKVTMTFTVTHQISELVVNAHRLVIDPHSITITNNENNKSIGISTTKVVKDYENGMLIIPLTESIFPDIQYSLSIAYFGFIFSDPHGGVLSNYNFYEFNGKKGWIFSTDFETGPGSRSLMVCCDEPSYKAMFKITVKHAADMTALSNTLDLGSSLSTDGWAVTRFQETRRMSSYLVAICVGHFASMSAVSDTGVLVRVFSWTGMEKYADFSLKIMAGTLDYMTRYFNYEYPLSKLDMVALPQHSDQTAMENWGLILGNYNRLMLDEEYADVTTMNLVAVTIAHEVVHQWFGDLVTMKWWSEIFLNEGFAEYWSYNGVNYTFPEQQDYVMSFARFNGMTTALENDCDKESIFPVISDEGETLRPAVYMKGSALLQVLSNVISPHTVQKGLRKYISEKVYANANVEELWRTLTEACRTDGVKGWDGKTLDVAKFMESWTKERSFPIVKVSIDSNGSISYLQESCIEDNTTWYIPIFSASRTGKEFNWFYGKNGSSPFWSQTFPLERVDNVESASYMRIHYDRMLLPLMVRNINILRDSATQGTILRDAWFFVLRGDYSWSLFLDLVNAVDWQDSPMTWSIGLEFIQEIHRSFRFHSEYRRVVEYLMSILNWTYQAIGRSNNPSNNWSKLKIGSSINEWMCRFNNRHCLETASTQFSQFIVNCGNSHHGTGNCARVVPDFRRSMYCYGLKQHPKADSDIYLHYKYFDDTAKYFNRDGGKLLYALSCLDDPKKLQKYIHLTLNDELPEIFLSFVSENDVTGHVLFDYFKDHTQEVLDSNVDFATYIEAMTGDWSNKEQLAKLISFETASQYKLLDDHKRAEWEIAVQNVIDRQSDLKPKTEEILTWLQRNFLPKRLLKLHSIA